MHRKFAAHLELTKSYWQKHLEPPDIAIDATCGNGYDTLFLAQLPIRAVWGIDIQPKAIEHTRKILEAHGVAHHVVLHCGSHENFAWVKTSFPPQLIVYNLGYLPTGDKNLTTQTKTTLASLQAALPILGDRGAISITCYPGHTEGEKEEQAILSWAKSLTSTQWHVCHHRWINRDRSPTVFWIQKIYV